MTQWGAAKNQRRPLVVGEVLFDVLPDGTRVLGGAPLNVAWHLEAFGLRPFMITMGWPNRTILERALKFAAAMCTVPGATVGDRDFYSRFRAQGWW